MKNYKKNDRKEFPCIICGTLIPVLDLGSYDAMELGQNMWNGGTVDAIFMPFGSKLDGDSYFIGICDDCIEKKEKEGIIIKRVVE